MDPKQLTSQGFKGIVNLQKHFLKTLHDLNDSDEKTEC